MTYATLAAFVDRMLPLVESSLESATKSDAFPGCPETLREAMRYTLLQPGKRLRPLLVLLAADACGGETDHALSAACAVEMVHVFSLIHDDLPAMDNDDLRRGKPSNHKQFGEGEAILAGDALLALAFDVLVSGGGTHIPAAVRVLACAAGAPGICGGQSDDLRKLSDVASVAQRKTGALFEAAALLGALSAEATDAKRQLLSDFGARMGVAFQIIDDVLDVAEGDDAPSFVSVFGKEESTRKARQLVSESTASLLLLGSQGELLRQFAQSLIGRLPS